MDGIKPRYEFRVWADTLAPVHERLGRLAQPKTTESQETYLIPTATDECNAKIRAALMDWRKLTVAPIKLDRRVDQCRRVAAYLYYKRFLRFR